MNNKIIKCISCGDISKHRAKQMCQKCYDAEFYINNKEWINKRNAKYRLNNLDKCKLHQFKYTKKNPIKIKAQNYASKHKQKGDFCKWCKSINNKLHFHHTDYENNIGFTLCDKCHKYIHRGVMLG